MFEKSELKDMLFEGGAIVLGAILERFVAKYLPAEYTGALAGALVVMLGAYVKHRMISGFLVGFGTVWFAESLTPYMSNITSKLKL